MKPPTPVRRCPMANPRTQAARIPMKYLPLWVRPLPPPVIAERRSQPRWRCIVPELLSAWADSQCGSLRGAVCEGPPR
jgi:hypothetical protein